MAVTLRHGALPSATFSDQFMIFRNLNNKDLRAFLKLYDDSFPENERRLYEDTDALSRFIRENSSMFRIIAAEDENGKFAGFLTYWQFPQYNYVEHFAVRPDLRGNGLGKAMLAHLHEIAGSRTVLEVELPSTGHDAERRISFYKSCGFTDHPEINYIQPPYSPNQEGIPLMLMTHGETDLSDLFPIYKYVYKANPSTDSPSCACR